MPNQLVLVTMVQTPLFTYQKYANYSYNQYNIVTYKISDHQNMCFKYIWSSSTIPGSLL